MEKHVQTQFRNTGVTIELGIKKLPFRQPHSKLERNKIICLTNENNAIIENYPNLTRLVRNQKFPDFFLNIKIVKQVLRNACTLQLFQISGCCTRPCQNHHHMSDLRLVVLEERVADAERHHGNTILTKFSAAKTLLKWLRFHIDGVNHTIYVCKKNELFSMSNQANAINPNLWPSPYKSSAHIFKENEDSTHEKANPLNYKNAQTPHAFSVFSKIAVLVNNHKRCFPVLSISKVPNILGEAAEPCHCTVNLPAASRPRQHTS